MKVNSIIGSSYLCSKFVNHDGTLVSDHPIYSFELDDGRIACVMFVSRTNPFTTHYPDGKDLGFIACSDHQYEQPGKRFFQAEVYVFDKNLINNKKILLSEYKFKYSLYNREICKAIRQALKFNSIKSVHMYDNKDDVEEKQEILNALSEFMDTVYNSGGCNAPEMGPVNTTYNEYKKAFNSSNIKYENEKIFRNRRVGV